MSATTTNGRFDIGRVVQRTFDAIRANLAVFAGLSVLLSGVPAGLLTWVGYNAMHAIGVPFGSGMGAAPLATPKFDPSSLPYFLGGGGAAWFVALLAGLTLQASIIYGAIAFLNGRQATFAECLGAALRHLPLLVLLGLTMFVAEIFGAMLFFFPAVMMAMAWFVAVPVLVTERTGVFGALGRSGDLTRKHRWAIFGLAIVYGVVYLVFQQILIGVTMTFSGGSTIGGLMGGQLVVGVLMGAAGHLVSTTGAASVYYELRWIKEGVGPEALAAVFD